MHLPCLAAMSLFPTSNVIFAVPFSTISITVLNAFGDNRSVGEIKFPAALLITIFGRPRFSTTVEMALLTPSESLTSVATGSI